LTGSDDPNFTADQAAAIGNWLKTGGTLIIDQAGGPKKKGEQRFDLGVRKLAEAVYKDSPMGTMVLGHPLIKDFKDLTYRHISQTRTRKETPMLECVVSGDRTPIIYSKYDITSGLLAVSNPLVVGLDDDSAYKLMTSFLTLYSRGNAGTAKTAPASTSSSTGAPGSSSASAPASGATN
jgi:hypothetical protein